MAKYVLEIASGGPASWETFACDRFEVVGELVYLYETVRESGGIAIPDTDEVTGIYKLHGLRVVQQPEGSNG